MADGTLLLRSDGKILSVVNNAMAPSRPLREFRVAWSVWGADSTVPGWPARSWNSLAWIPSSKERLNPILMESARRAGFYQIPQELQEASDLKVWKATDDGRDITHEPEPGPLCHIYFETLSSP